jgi:parvulin-like peptidyl-prolyl isomerase
MALRRTKRNDPDDDLLEEEEEVEEDDIEEEEEEEPEREFPRWLKPLIMLVCLFVVGGAGAFAGYLWEKNHARANDVVATINGEPIDIQYLQHRIDMVSGNATAHTVAQENLLLQYAKKEGALPPEQDVEAKYKELSKDKSKFDIEMFRNHESADDIKRSIRLNMARTALLTKDVSVSEQEAQKYYEANINPANPNAQFFRPETVLISVIVCRSQAAIEKAAAALKEGQPFPNVATLYSEDNSKVNGGQLPVIKRGQPGLEKSPELAKIIFSLKPQQTFGPAKLGSGNAGAYWLIRCADRRDPVTLPFDRVRDEAFKGMMLYKGQQVNGRKTQLGLDAFQAESKINVRWVTYSDAITAKSTDTK